MKKFFLTILLVITTVLTVAAQTPLNLDVFQTQVTKGQCNGDSKLKVSVPATMGPSGTKLQVKVDIPNDPVGRTAPLEIGVTGKDSYEFPGLKTGVYSVTLIEVATNKRSTIRAVNVTSNYVPPVFTTFKTTPPNCAGAGVDGKIEFTIQKGAKGPFLVTLKKGTTTITQQTFTNPNLSQPFAVTLQGTAATPITSGAGYELSVEDKAGGVPNCGDTNFRTFSVNQPDLNSIDCMEFVIDEVISTLRRETNCKFIMSFGLKRKDNINIYSLESQIKAKANTMVVKRYNSAGVLQGTYDLSATYQNAERPGESIGYSYSTKGKVAFEENDIVEITLTLGKTPYTKKFKLDENLVDILKNNHNTTNSTDPTSYHYLSRDGSLAIDAVDRSDLNVTGACNVPNKRYMLVTTYNRKLKLPNPDNAADKFDFGYYYWQNLNASDWLSDPTVGTRGFYFEIYKYTGTGYPGLDQNFTGGKISDSSQWQLLTPNLDYTWINNNGTLYADLGGQPDGYYKAKFKTKGYGPSCTEPEHIAEIKTTNTKIGDRFEFELNRGAYKGTVTLRKWLAGYHFDYPITVKLDYIDDGGTGTRTYTFKTGLPFEPLRDVTYTFPMVKTAENPDEPAGKIYRFEFGDIPAGQYNVTITDRCGNTETKQLTIDTPMVYTKDELKVEQGCEGTSKVSYDVQADHIGTLQYLNVTLYKKNTSGVWERQGTTRRERAYTFNNLSSGEYKIEATNFYHARIKTIYNLGKTNEKVSYFTDPTSSISGYSEIYSQEADNETDLARKGRILLHVSRVEFTISPTAELIRDVVPTSCSKANGTGLVAVRIMNPENISYPLKFTLKKSDGTEFASTTFQAGSQATGYVFKNVPNGTYIVETQHNCGTYYDTNKVVDTNNYTAPGITYVPLSTSPCNGDVIRLTFGGSAQLFDIEWFRIEADNSQTSLGTSQTITDTVKRATHYLVRYSLSDTSLCVVNPSGVASITPQFTPDTTPPVITGCPTGTITVSTLAGECYGVATWGIVTATDDCHIATWSQTHQSGQQFNIGLHTVTYVFEDTSGNTATCTFNVEVTSNAIDMKVTDAFVDGTNGVITHNLATTESFNYRIQYNNAGQENVTSATMTIKLPNHPGVTVGTPDFSGARETTYVPTIMGQTGSTFTISIPGQTLRPGQATRTIIIPLQLNGNCDEFGKPCMNILEASYTFKYEGGRPNCIVPEQTNTGSTTIQVSTALCNRTELYCPSDDPNTPATQRLTAITGFDRYIWYKDNVQQVSTLHYIDATATGTYKVEKIKECNGTTYTTTEQIQLVGGDTITDPIRSQANGGDVCASDQAIFMNHIILCNEPSKTLRLNFRDTRVEWQRLKAGQNPNGQNCPNTNDSAWETVSTASSFTVSATAHYRLRVTNNNNTCQKVFYFDVFNNALSGEITNYNDIDSYRAGNVSIKMATSGINYKYVLKDSNGVVKATITKNSSIHAFTITEPGTYVIEVTSPALPQTCKWVVTQEIKKTLKFTAKATAKAWKGCNTRVINFQASGGDPTFSFAVWSIDDVVQNGYTDYADVQASDYIATGIPIGIIGQDRDVHIEQPGRYVFLAKDAQNAYALTTPVDIYPEDFLGYEIGVRNIVCGDLPNSGQISITYNTQQNVQSTLYKFNEFGGKTQVGTPNTTGFFTNLSAGKYEVEIKITMGSHASATCTYRNPNLEVKSLDSSIRAFAGIAEDISCDTSSPTKQYKVIVNNVSGGTGSGYEFSTDNVTFSTNPVLMVGSTASVVYVRDSNKCVLEIPIQIQPIVPATITTTAVQYNCDGKGTFTVTTNPTGNYRFQITNANGTLSETRTSNVFTLSPDVYSIYAIYTPENVTGTTPNILYKEDFGTGLDTCDSDVIFLTCNANGTALTNNQYMITRQVPTSPNWVNPTPTDASSVSDGRYLAINGGSITNDNGVVYRRTITGVVPGQELSVSVNLFNLIPTNYVGAVNPNLVVRLYNPGNLTQYVEKSLGELTQQNRWVNKKVTFAASQVTYSSVRFEIRNNADGTQTLGSDFAVDDITIWQPTKVCEVRADGISVNVEQNRRFAARGTAHDEKCGQDDGEIYLTVDNATSNAVEYQLAGTTTWTSITLTPITALQGVATITGLSAVNNGTIYIRKASEPTCVTSFNYTIKKPVPLTVTATIQAPVSCQNVFASVRFTAEGGARPYTTFRYSPIGTGTAAATKAAVNNEADFSLEQGTYRIEAVDANGCVASATFVVPNVRPLQIEVVDLEPCFAGGATGRLQVNVLSGNGDYQYSKDGGVNFQNGGTSFEFGNLTAGSYNIVVRDGGACSTNTTYTIMNPLRIQTILDDPKSCAPNSQAKYKITYSGGRTGTRQFLWSNNPTTGFTVAIPTGMVLNQNGNTYEFNTSVEGDYYFKVRYLMDNGDYCEVVSDKQTVEIVAPKFTATPTVEKVNCAGANTGKILLDSSSITGGVAPYIIRFDNGLITRQLGVGDIVGLAPGTYTLTIEDSANCTSAPMPVVVTEVPAMVATVTHTNLKCVGGGTQLSTISAQVLSGGTAPFTVILRKNGVTDETRANVQEGDFIQFTNKDIGRYEVLIEDAKGCKFTNNFQITSDANNLDVNTNGVNACYDASGEVKVSVFASSGGTIGNGQYIAIYREGIPMPLGATGATHPTGVPNEYWYRMSNVATTTLSDGSQAQASTYVFSPANLNGLAPGVRYTFIVYDPNTGCSFTKEANMKVPASSPLEITATGTKPTTCASADDGEFQFNIKNWPVGTVTYRVFKYPPQHPNHKDPVDALGNPHPVLGTLTLSGTPATGEDTKITGIPAGRYFVLFTDANACTMGSEEFTIGKSNSQLTISATVTKNANCKQPTPTGLGRIVVDAQGGVAPYQYYYEPISAFSVPALSTASRTAAFIANNDHGTSRDVVSGLYRVYVRDANGCDQYTEVTVGLDSSPSIASVAVQDACADNADYPISVIFATKGVGQHSYKIDGINNWQNLTMPSATDNEVLLPIRLAPNVASYTLSIRDGNGCETSTTFRVNEMIKFQAAHTQLVPCGNGTADIQVTNITGGSGTYRIGVYRISEDEYGNQRNAPIITADNVTGNSYTVNGATYTITAGTYRINVYDGATFGTSAECAQTMLFTVVPPQMPTIEVLSITTPACYSGTATIRAKVIPVADAPYVFDLLNTSGISVIGAPVVATTNTNYVTFEGVPSGAVSLGGAKYTITAKSSLGCTVKTVVAVISPDQVTITTNALTKRDYTCEREDGYLTGETSYPQLKFNLEGVTGGTLPYSRIEFRELGTGTVINQQAVETDVTQYTYTLPSYLTADTNYYVKVYDANGCEAITTPVTISSTLMMSSLAASQVQALTCANGAEIINITLSTTTAYNNELIEYKVVKAGTIDEVVRRTLSNTTFNGVSITEAGNYVITARNLSTECEVSTNYTVLSQETLLLEAKDPVAIECKGGTGQITLQLTDTRLTDGDQVANGFNYLIYDIATNNVTVSGTTVGTITPGKGTLSLYAGKYRVVATSPITGCSAYTTFEMPEAERDINVFARETASVTCDYNRGEILVTVTGGWAPYKVNIAGGAISANADISIDGDSVLFQNLVAPSTSGGILTYTITITDAKGCQIATGTTQVPLLSPDSISATVTVTQHATCFGSSDGIIDVVSSTVTGGSGNYYYSLIDANYQVKGPQRNNTRFDNLYPGIYTYEIMDTWGCSLSVYQIEIIEPKPITVSATNTKLLVCYGGRDGVFDFEIAGGRPPYNVEIVDKYTNITYHRETGVYTDTRYSPNSAPGGQQYPAGTYKIIITDSGQGAGVGCTMSPSYEFTVYSAPDLDAETAQGYNCDNNEFTTFIEVRFKDEVNFNNMTYKLNNAGVPQTFSRNNGVNIGYIDQTRFDRSIATQTLEVFYTNVHSVTGESRDCNQVLTKPITVEEIYQISNIVKTPTTVVNTLQVEGVGGKKPYRYEFNGEYYDDKNIYELKLNDPDYTDPVSGKTYKIVKVRVFDSASLNPNPGTGCVFEKIFYEEYFDIFLPNFFTPNGDGTYDTWAPRNVEKYPFIRTSIFDRYGRRITVLNYGEEWDGKYEGRDMPTGDYWYIVELGDENDSRTFNGNFTLYR